MAETQTDAIIKKMYEEIVLMRQELDEIRAAIIPETEPDADELEAIRAGENEVAAAKYKSWDDFKRELES